MAWPGRSTRSSASCSCDGSTPGARPRSTSRAGHLPAGLRRAAADGHGRGGAAGLRRVHRPAPRPPADGGGGRARRRTRSSPRSTPCTASWTRRPTLGVHCVAGGARQRLPVALQGRGGRRRAAARLPRRDRRRRRPAVLAAVAAGKPAEVLLVLGADARAATTIATPCGRPASRWWPTWSWSPTTTAPPGRLRDVGGQEPGRVQGRDVGGRRVRRRALPRPARPRGGTCSTSRCARTRARCAASCWPTWPRSARASVTDLRQFTVSETVYRAADTNAVVTALLKAGQVTRYARGAGASPATSSSRRARRLRPRVRAAGPGLGRRARRTRAGRGARAGRRPRAGGAGVPGR